MNGPTLMLVAAIGTIVAVALAPILKNYGAPVPVVM